MKVEKQAKAPDTAVGTSEAKEEIACFEAINTNTFPKHIFPEPI